MNLSYLGYNNIFESGELLEESVVSKMETTAAEIVTMYLDYAERLARRGNIMYIHDWVGRLDAFLQFNEEDILHDKGKVTAAIEKTFFSPFLQLLFNSLQMSRSHM